MNFNKNTSDVLAPRDIRRYPSELDRVSSRGALHSVETGRKVTFAEVAAGVDSANGAVSTPTEPPPAKNEKPFSLWEKEGFGFGDLVDIINPLHHIPIVATIYRNLSGDQIGAAPRVIGGALWGKIGGFVAGVVNAIVEWWSGKDIGEQIYAAVFGDPKKVDGVTAVAQKKVSPADAASGSVATRIAPTPQSDDTVSATSVEPPPAAAPDGDVVSPAALRPELPSILGPAARIPFSSYEKNLGWDESKEPIRMRYRA